MTHAFDANDAKQFRQVLGHFPTGVTIVTGMAGDIPAGFTIGSFTSVSLEPPLVGFLPQIDSDTWAAMAGSGRFCVNVLRDTQADLCWRFAKSGVGDGRFDEVDWTMSPSGCPILHGVGAWIDCTLEHSVTFGDHHFVVGRVVALHHEPEPHTPLVFYKGALGGFLAAE
jgi:3-hydroxy-9,10-secoandrosta-1,3,5(10)-triene-9,17-dione monooxygenase reductase component